MTPDQHLLCGAYAVDALDDTERAVFESHVATCPDCQAEVAGLEHAAQSLAVLTETAPPPRLRAAVLESIGRVRPLAPAVEPAGSEPTAVVETATSVAPVIQLRRNRATWLVAVAAAAAIIFGGFAWSPWSNGGSTPTGFSQIQAAGDATSVSETRGSTRATVVRSREMDLAAITVSGLDPAPSGRTYQLWLADSTGAMHPAGLLVPAGDGSASMVLTGPAATASAVGVTVEPAGGSPEPTTDPVMVMELT